MSANGYTGNPPGSGGGGGGAWADITGKPSTFPPSVHTHPISDVAALQAALDAKAALAHTHAISAVTGLQAALDGKAATAHSHAISDVTGLQAALDGKAALASPSLTGTPTAPTAAPGTNSTQLATTAYVTAAVAVGGGGGGTPPTFTRARVTGGDLTTTNDATFAVVPGLSMVAPGVDGDNVTLTISGLLDMSNSGSEYFDLAVMVGGSVVQYASTGTNTPAVEGDPALYPGSGVRFRGTQYVWSLTLGAGDVSGGNVTFQFVHKGAGSAKVLASNSYPLRWAIRNDH